eukprot:gnl/Hemi2/27813_TR9189_c0_g1_i1.p1 gnl/Hemi2/27813_TR9189_c0_g1~~gnl/Hemi2/27813_TR9189_c0_g1_i1.p1  ORF type:complete len:382 (-),score=140.79 gnl/Hemi2/27813_TR9189_c0_g1_i1:242-1387(-)
MAEFNHIIANQPVVIDNGSGVIKAGFAADEEPKCKFPTFVGRPKHLRVMAGALEQEYLVGARAAELRGILRLNYPMSHGIIEDWNEMERIWSYLYKEELKIPAEDHPVLLTEPPLNPRRNRERVAEIFFETYNVPALFISMQSVLSLYASGRTTGVVLDSGDGVTHAVPIYEGFAMPHAISRIDVAGRDITEHLQLLLRKAGYRFHTTAEKEVVRAIKEAACLVSPNPLKDEGDVTEKNFAAYPYTLPDGNVIQIGAERFRAPELLFHPVAIGLEYPGIHECLVSAIHKADLDLRRTLYSQIVLSGGSTMLGGFGERLAHELRKLAPKDVRIRIHAPAERQISTFVGGSILSSLSTFKRMWISASEYQEDGPSVLHKKTFL